MGNDFKYLHHQSVGKLCRIQIYSLGIIQHTYSRAFPSSHPTPLFTTMSLYPDLILWILFDMTGILLGMSRISRLSCRWTCLLWATGPSCACLTDQSTGAKWGSTRWLISRALVLVRCQSGSLQTLAFRFVTALFVCGAGVDLQATQAMRYIREVALTFASHGQVFRAANGTHHRGSRWGRARTMAGEHQRLATRGTISAGKGEIEIQNGVIYHDIFNSKHWNSISGAPICRSPIYNWTGSR